MRQFRPHLADLGITEQQWRVLRVLGEDGPSDAGQVAERACILPSSFSRIVKTLAAMKLVATSSDRDDGRRSIVALTERGETTLEQALPQSSAIYADLERRLGGKTLQLLLDLLDEVQTKLG